jgi:hypothetical protein
MAHWLDAGAAAFAFVAAVFWFLSAFRSLPVMGQYFDHVPPNDPFYRAIKFSARMNTCAAGVSGLSALCMAARIAVY